MKITPNIVYPFTHVNPTYFSRANAVDILTSKKYIIPDYWFETTADVVEFSKHVKYTTEFLDYFEDLIRTAINMKCGSVVAFTLRTNENIVFVKVDHTHYIETIDRLIGLNTDLERYENCQDLKLLKESLNKFKPKSIKNIMDSVFKFWDNLYPVYL